ncbi:MAG TPA: prepilin-type N-terminal cleavage/methylation domain-containing protein [Pyrinomonadaceae bacterium]|nr:prepilin-type N-terminal cleavage/methylation domain-containing protein [Pyrinomonadaceae bacterium]
MRSGFYKFSEESGVSVPEILIVVVIISIISAIAVMQFSAPGGANQQFKRQNVARELKVAFERARFDSVKRHAEGAGPANVIVDTNSYTLKTDSNNDGTYETVTTNFAAQNVTIAGYTTMTLPVTVSFDKRGEVTTSGGVNPQFLVCNGTCPQTPTSSNANLVLVTPTGTVNLLAGNMTPPTFANASVTNVSPTTGVSNTVSLP